MTVLLFFSQVRISSILDHRVRGQNYRAALTHINQKSVYFLVCRADNLEPIIAIELDDITYDSDSRRVRDCEVETIFKNANMPLFRTRNVDISTEDLKSGVMKTLNSENKN